MSDSNSGAHPLDALAEEFVARHRRGERPSVGEYAARHPELADDIRDLFPGLVLMEDVRPRVDATGPFAAALTGPGPDRLGDYRIVREVGAGGMGVVYEAEQLSLGRHVALKVLTAHGLLNTTFLERFRREARAAARLHHTNIVPVFGVGEAEGVHYYAMQFIQGQGLDAVLRDLRRLRKRPDTRAGGADAAPACGDGSVAQGLLTGQFEAPAGAPPVPARPPPAAPAPAPAGLSGGGSEAQYYRSVARVGLQAAEALAYAHRQGVLHRDVKPSNLLLDQQGTVWVTDFGLAKAEGADDLTCPGDVVGTVRYMAPERFAGRSFPQSDVYSLGLTLYELLTLRPAFDDSDKARLMERVLHEAPPTPRKLDPHVPRDLETVVLKCLARDVEGRYATAEAVAEDLRRFLADRPVLARRTPWYGRARRWCRRNPWLAGSLAAVLVLLAVLAGGGAGMSWRLRSALSQSEGDREQAVQDRRTAREKLFEARVAEAKANRFSRRAGQRFATLEALREAAALARELDKPPETFVGLRDLAVTALALPDLRPAPGWVSCPADKGWVTYGGAIDDCFRLYAVTEQYGAVSIRRVVAGPAEAAEVARLPGFGGEARPEWAPGGLFLAVWHWQQGPRLQVWRIHGGKPALALEEPAGCLAFGFGPDGRRLVTVGKELLRVYDLESGKVERAFPAPAGVWEWAAHHPHRPEVALPTPHAIVVLDLTTGKEVRRLPTPALAGQLLWHPDGELLAATFTHSVQLWDVARQRLTWDLEHRGGGTRVAFNEAGDLLASNGWAGRMRLWGPHTGREVFTEAGWASRFGPGDRLATIGRLANPRPLTRVEAGREYRTLVAGAGRPDVRDYRRCSVHPGGRLLAVGTVQGVSLLDLATGAERAFLPEGGPFTRFEPSGALLTNTAAGLFRLPVRPDPQAPHRLLVGPPERVPARALPYSGEVAANTDGTVLAVGNSEAGAYVWHRDRPREGKCLRPHPDCRTVAVSPDGTLVATGSFHGRGLKVWDARTGGLLREFLPTTGMTRPFFSPDGRWLLNEGGQSWRVADWSEGPRHPGGEVTFSPDGRLAAWAEGKGAVVLASPETGREVARLEGPDQDRLSALTFSPDGTLLLGVTGDSFCVHVWDLRKVRRGLVELGLDWDAPPYPPEETADGARPAPLQVEVLGAEKLVPPPTGLQLNDQAWALVTGPAEKRDAVRALPLARRAAQMCPDSQACLNTLGVVLCRLGQYDEAVGVLEKSLAAGSGKYDGFDLFFLAMCHQRAGRTAAARECFDRAVRWAGGQKGLSARHAAELKEFRAEAEAVLREQ